MARTSSTDLFKKSTKVETVQTPFVLRNTEVEAEVQKHYRIKISAARKFKTFLMSKCACFRKSLSKKDPDNARLHRLYQVGQERLNEDLSIERIIKSLRDMRILIKNKFLDDDLKF